MGLGDSITEGSDDFASFLFPLWEKLMSAGYESISSAREKANAESER